MSHLQSRDAALYVYLAWGTRGDLPVLGCEELRQAAYLAITTRTRSQFCHVLAIGGTAGRIHLIAQFPPSMSISVFARIAQDAGGSAIARQSEAFQGRLISRDHLWEHGYLTHTLRPSEAAEPEAYLRQESIAKDDSKDSQLALNFS